MNDRPSVLIVDNNRDTRESLRDLLTAAGYETEISGSVTTGQRLLAKAQSPCIVLLNRIGNPTTGLDFVRMAEHEEYLLSIAERVLKESLSTEEPAEVKAEVLPKPKHKSGEFVRVRPVAANPALDAMIAERRAYQAMVATEMRRSAALEKKVA